MTDEMKLLRALCDALGFEVKTDADFMPMQVDIGEMRKHSGGRIENRQIESKGGKWVIDDEGLYTSVLSEPLISYRLKRKPTPGYLLRDQAE